MADTDQPLLDRQNSHSSSSASEDLERGLDSGAGHDFKHLIDSQPEAVIKYVFRLWRLRSLARLYRQYAAATCIRPLPASLKNWYQPVSFHLQVGVCRFLEKKGMAQLGSFNVPVRHFPQRPQQLSLLGMPHTKIAMLQHSQGPTCMTHKGSPASPVVCCRLFDMCI